MIKEEEKLKKGLQKQEELRKVLKLKRNKDESDKDKTSEEKGRWGKKM